MGWVKKKPVICVSAEVEWSHLPYLIEEGNGFCTDNGLAGSQDKYPWFWSCFCCMISLMVTVMSPIQWLHFSCILVVRCENIKGKFIYLAQMGNRSVAIDRMAASE
jgi:hypothetical protein